MTWVSAVVRAVIGAALGLAIVVPAASAAAPEPPAQDPFYTYPGNLGQIAPGTVLKERTVTIDSLAAAPTPLPAIQLLFRTTDQLGDPALAVTTVIEPLSSAAPPKIFSYQAYYDTLGSQCDPSYELQGGPDSSRPARRTARRMARRRG